MSTPADVSRPAGRQVPVYKRKRRRIYAAIGAAAIVAIALIIWAVTQGSSGTALPGFTITYGQGTVANSDSIIASDPALAKTIPAGLHFVPFDAGVTAIAEMRSGSLEVISGVGNPPVVGAIGTDTGITVVIAQSFDADALIVPPSITAPAQLAGKSVGVLVGSSEDYELRGWLALEHLTSSVKVIGFASEQAASAAYLGGSVSAAYVQAGPEAALIAKGGHPITDAEQIAKLGVPGLNVVAVADSVIKSDPTLVQKYVCAEVQATRLFTGPQAAKYLTNSASVQGVPGNLIVTATKSYPFIPLSQQLYWLGSFPHELSGGMQRRAAFARAMVTRPSLLLMDEPFGALDAITRVRMHEFLLRMWERYRITIIFVTHDIEEAVLLGDRVAVMGGRPPGIREVIDVPLRRPRRAIDVNTEEFLEVKRQIRASLIAPAVNRPGRDRLPARQPRKE